jgi:rhodanese-related sulfurtransferase
MREAGITNVHALLGGFQKWKDATKDRVNTGEKP